MSDDAAIALGALVAGDLAICSWRAACSGCRVCRRRRPSRRAGPRVVAVVPARNEADGHRACHRLAARPGLSRRLLDRAGRRPQQRRHRRDRARSGARPCGSSRRSSPRRRCRTAGPASSGRSAQACARMRGDARALSSSPTPTSRITAAILRELVARLEAEQRDLVSLMVQLHCDSFAETIPDPGLRVLLRHALSLRLGRTIRASRTAAAAGGCMLIRRAAYERIGGYRRDQRRVDRRLRAGAAVKSAAARSGSA